MSRKYQSLGRTSGPVLARRQLLRAAGLGVLGLGATRVLTACGSDDAPAADGATTTLDLQLSWIPDVEFGPLFLADSNGHFANENVAINFIPGGPDIGSIEGIVAGGSADVGISTDITTVVASIADGNPLVAIGALYQSNLNVFLSSPDAPITSVQDMVGKRIGGPQGAQIKFDGMFAIAGLDPDYTFVPIGYGPDALINGDCDVQVGFVTDEVLAYEKTTGTAPVVFTFTDAGLPAYTLPLHVTRSTLESSRDALKGMLRAIVSGCDEAMADPDSAATLAAETYGKDAGLTFEAEQAKYEKYLPLMSSSYTEQHGWLWIDADYLAGPIYQGMTAAGLKTVDVDQAIDMSLLEEIAAES